MNICSCLIYISILWTYILSNNATYVATDIYNKQMYSVGNSIVERINENSEITTDMPIYPAKDSIRIIDGIVVVKLNND